MAQLPAWIVGILLIGTAFAQDNAEIVVTASRYVSDADEMTVQIPHVTLTRRADNLVTRIRVVCDTRDTDTREQELDQTLRDMIQAAGASGGSIALSVGDEVLEPFTDALIEKSIQLGDRVDTSAAFVVVKTAIGPSDTYDAAMARIHAFVAATPKTGRTEILEDGRWDLTLIGPENYRGELIGLIAADARKTAAQFGAAFSVSVDGLEKPIAWRRSGLLELGLYIPYTLVTAGVAQP